MRFCESAFPSHIVPMYEICCEYMRVGSQRGQHILSKEKGFVIQDDLTEKADSDRYTFLTTLVHSHSMAIRRKEHPLRPFTLYLYPGNQEY